VQRNAARRTGGIVAALSRGERMLLWTCGLIGLAGLAFHLAHGQLGLGGSGVETFDYNWIYDGLILGSAVACLARAARVREERAAWLMIGAGLAFDAFGEIYYTFAFGDTASPPTPSLADVFYLLYYPGIYAGLVLLARARIERLSPSTWLDGAIAAITAAAVAAAVAWDPILHAATKGDAAAVATNLAYPIGDLVLLVFAVGVFALSGWRPGKALLWLGAGVALTAVADTAYLYESAKGTYVVGGILDSMWIASALAIGVAAWQRPSRRALRLEGRRLLAVPGACATVSLGVLLSGGFHHVGTGGLLLAAAAVLLVFARAAWTFHENVVLLDASRHDALTDALTGLGNRRAMSATLDRFFRAAAGSRSAVLVMFDLDGFKLYNDRFGHIAGDALLAHLGLRLRRAIGEHGSCFRLGGDEFCVLLRVDPAEADADIAAAVEALSAEGHGFDVRTSFGTVVIPDEARVTTVALRIADDRMYAHKGGRRSSARQQTHDVLLGVLREREPDLHEHLREVGRLAVLAGRWLGMSDGDLDELRRAAELHDVGKAAIPDAILNKHGPLDPHEWEFMRRHTVVGERILAAAPALAPMAVIVRSSHECWNGTGYPDRLAGEQIPLGARVVHVCDAFHAMISDRPYAPAIEDADAIGELQRSAGTQFDPRVVEAFVAAWEAGALAPAPVAAPAPAPAPAPLTRTADSAGTDAAGRGVRERIAHHQR
jgi:two-component system cell cycle response regulator